MWLRLFLNRLSSGLFRPGGPRSVDSGSHWYKLGDYANKSYHFTWTLTTSCRSGQTKGWQAQKLGISRFVMSYPFKSFFNPPSIYAQSLNIYHTTHFPHFRQTAHIMPAIPPFDGADAAVADTAGADTEAADALKRSLIVSVISCVLSFLSPLWAICTKVYDLHNKKSARKAT